MGRIKLRLIKVVNSCKEALELAFPSGKCGYCGKAPADHKCEIDENGDFLITCP